MAVGVRSRASFRSSRSWRDRAGLAVVGLVSFAIAVVSIATYTSGSLAELADDGRGLASTYFDAHPIVVGALYLHIGSAVLALVLGPVQFSRRIRQRAAVHRVLGRTYLTAVALGAGAAAVILPFNSAGMVGFFGFGMLAALWAYTGLRAYRSIRAGDIPHHHAWMLRNYALTFAAPTLRIWLGLLIAVQVPFAGADPDFDLLFDNAYAAVPFLCWIPNIIVAEWLVRRRGLPSYQLVPAAPARPA